MRQTIFLIALLFSTSLIWGQDAASESMTTFEERIPGTDVVFKMVLIPGGEFTLGSEEGEEDETPPRTVQVDSFWIGQFEVRFDEYEIYRERDRDSDSTRTPDSEYSADAVSRPSPPYEDPTFGMGKYGFPAGSMTQFAALKYCKWLSEKTGRFYRLPTEAEWEYAARAGTETAYFFGDDPENLDQYAWYYENSDDSFHPCGSKEPNPWGLYDMYGNVAEWTLDQYQADFYTSLGDSAISNPWRKPKRLHPRTVKGGSFMDDPEELRSANRIESSMDWKMRDPQIPKSFWWNTDSPFVGFRLVVPAKDLSPEEVKAFWDLTLGG
ncbi:MAG: SUMF1/EgtB/PvdO family nonheme iron enzyme [Bacteroidota bacterium]